MMNTVFSLETGNDDILTPAETVMRMFECTDENGELLLRQCPDEGDQNDMGQLFRCTMDWNRADAEKTAAEVTALHAALTYIAQHGEDPTEETMPADRRQVWDTYIRDLEADGFDEEQIAHIRDRVETVRLIDTFAGMIRDGKEISENERAFYENFKDTTVSEEERALYQAYREVVCADSQRRIGGDPLTAYHVIIRAKRLYMLMFLSAPQLVVDNEAALLAQAVVFHRHCRGKQQIEE